jgi:hypothetical protein
MYELIYCSAARQNLNKDDLDKILNTARTFNTKNNITGCLLYYKNEFIQILEGDKTIVKNLYNNINQDKRHENTILVAEGEKAERSFDSWSMAFYELNDDDVNDLCEQLFVDNFIAFSDIVKKPTFSTIMFWNMAKQLLKK